VGALRVTDGAIDVTPGAQQQREVLVALLEAAPSPVPVHVLHEVLWPAGAPSANALQSVVSKLRRALPQATITGGPGGYALELGDADELDARTIERLVATGRRAGAEGDHARARRELGAALELVRGEPFADIAATAPGRAASARLARLVAGARAGWIESRLELGELAEVCAELERLVVEDPVDEHWWALLVTVHDRAGRQAEALRAAQEARRVLREEFGLDPGPELREAERRVLQQDPGPGRSPLAGERSAASHPRRPARVPAPLSSLVGRDGLLAELATDLRRARLVTVVGPGGAGKTTVAFELARRVAASPGTGSPGTGSPGTGTGVVVVELAALADDGSVAVSVGDAVGVDARPPAAAVEAATGVIGRITDAVGAEPLLLVLDNCEHVVDAVAKLVHQLLAECPNVTVLATSREPLAVPGELVRRIPSLTTDEAAQLFTERAAAAGAAERLDPDLVTEICTRLDRLPLAIELAAARTRSMSLRDLADRLGDRFALLTSGPRTVEPRQQTLRAVVDWSHDLLDEAEAAAYRRLAAFRGGATIEAAEAVCAGGPLAPSAVVGTVERLIDKSLVVAHERGGTTRWSMLQTLHDDAATRLHRSGEAEEVLERHARWFASFLEPAHTGLRGREQRRWIERIDAERENIASALDAAVARGHADVALRIAGAMGWYFYMVGQADGGTAALADALSCPGPAATADRALVLAHHGWLAANGPSIGVALESTGDAVAMMGSSGDPAAEAFVLTSRIMVMFFAGRTDELPRLVDRAQQLADTSGDAWTGAIAALVRAEVAHHDGDVDGAEAGFTEAIERFAEVGDEFMLSIALAEASEIAELRGDYDGAAALLRRGIDISDRVGFSGHPLAMRTRLANIETLRGEPERAERMHLALLDELGDESLPWVRAMTHVGLAAVARRTGRHELADERLAEAWSIQRTRDLPLMRAIVLAARGYTADLAGRRDDALAFQLDGLRAVLDHPMARSMANALEGVSGALACGDDAADHELAARLLGGADALRRTSGGPMPAAERFGVDRAERRARAALGDAAFAIAFAAGATTPSDELVAAALACR